LLDVMQATIRAITAQAGLPELASARSASYATWLLSKIGPGPRDTRARGSSPN
jgi:hypothetical protein